MTFLAVALQLIVLTILIRQFPWLSWQPSTVVILEQQQAEAELDYPTTIHHPNKKDGSSSFPSFDDQQQKQQKLSNVTEVTFFYNVFLPQSNLDLAIAIVQEQLELIQKSYVFNKTMTLYYNTMGASITKSSLSSFSKQNTTATTTTSQLILSMCQKLHLTCIHLKHYVTGDEVNTLQAMYEFCQEQQQQQSTSDNTENDQIIRVGYLHNKGSFHDSDQNSKWRKSLTQAVIHESCWNPPSSSSSSSQSKRRSITYEDDEYHPNDCDSCGLSFLARPFVSMPGNFFVSRCDYLTKLIPPISFESKMRQFNRHMQRIKIVSGLDFGIYEKRESWIGLDRYAMEHWAHSHPFVVPCDLREYSKRFLPQEELPFDWYLYPNRPSHEEPGLEFPSHFELPGQLHKWSYLYHAIPPYNSWVWKEFKDGIKIQTALEQNGVFQNNLMTSKERFFE